MRGLVSAAGDRWRLLTRTGRNASALPTRIQPQNTVTGAATSTWDRTRTGWQVVGRIGGAHITHDFDTESDARAAADRRPVHTATARKWPGRQGAGSGRRRFAA